MPKKRERPVFSLYHGRSHGAWSYELLIPELNERGFQAIAHNFDIEADLDFEQHSRVAKEAERDFGAKHYILVGHSWGINPAIFNADETTLGVISIAGVPHKNSLAYHNPRVKMPSDMHTVQYATMVRKPSLENIRGLAKDTFYNDIEDQLLVDWAISQLREHPRREKEPVLKQFPNVPFRTIIPVLDMASNNRAQMKLANSMGVTYEAIDGGHCPMLSRPSVLADYYMSRIADIFMYEASLY